MSALSGFVMARRSLGLQDDKIRDQVLIELRDLAWARTAEAEVVVDHGVVHLWGIVRDAAERRDLREHAREVPGVREVEDHTVLVSGPWTSEVIDDEIDAVSLSSDRFRGPVYGNAVVPGLAGPRQDFRLPALVRR